MVRIGQLRAVGTGQMFDAGATEKGRPYFVLELVDGVKITAYCDQHALGLKERLELFVRICQAIQHAHQKGIVHRDIKPSNILVTTVDGVPVAWLERWATIRQTPDAALAVFGNGTAKASVAPATVDLSQFARRYGLTVICHDHWENDEKPEFPDSGSNECKSSLPPTPLRVRNASSHDACRAWGIND